MIRRISLAAVMVGGIVALDIASKKWALEALEHGYTLTGRAGVPLTLAFNTGVAFGLPLPSIGRYIIIVATMAVLVVLSHMFVHADRRDYPRLLAVQLVGAGAIGNLIDRVRWDKGVVDFIGPFDLGAISWPIFNVADMAITTGAIILALSLLREDAENARAAAAADEVVLVNTDGLAS